MELQCKNQHNSHMEFLHQTSSVRLGGDASGVNIQSLVATDRCPMPWRVQLEPPPPTTRSKETGKTNLSKASTFLLKCPDAVTSWRLPVLRLMIGNGGPMAKGPIGARQYAHDTSLINSWQRNLLDTNLIMIRLPPFSRFK